MRKVLSAPLDVQFDITRKCQLDCSYCCATPLDGHHTSTPAAVGLLEELGRMRVLSLLLSGGEATLHPDFLDILSAASSNIPMISFGSNGIKLARGRLARDVKALAPNCLITISLDSLNTEVHNSQRGAGGHLALRAIENCCALGIEINISCVVTELNVHEAHAIVDRYRHNVRKFSFFPRVSRAVGEKFANYQAFSNSFQELLERLNHLSDSNASLDIMVPEKPAKNGQTGTVYNSRSACSCVVTKAYITSDLSVFPCYYGAHPSNCYGSLTSSSFSDVWQSEKAEKIRNRAFGGSLCGMSFNSDAIPKRFERPIYGLVS